MEEPQKTEPKVIDANPKDDADGADSKLNGASDGCVVDHSLGMPPKCKILKTDLNPDMQLNPIYLSDEFTKLLRMHWDTNSSDDQFECPKTLTKIYKTPFQICLLPNLLVNKKDCNRFVNEIIQNVRWSRKQMDLYEFYQSTDLSNMNDCKLLSNFLQMLRRNVRPWLEKITNLKLDYVSASCSMYTSGDYLLVHDDLLRDRQIAFVYYLSPWADAENWSEAQGGCLEIFDSDENCFPQFPVKRKISPKNNQFVFFKVGARSFHQVGEVTNFDYPRLTINGWFHGATNNDSLYVTDSLRGFPKLEFKLPINIEGQVERMLNPLYLKPQTSRSIQKRMEENSEICLIEFFRREVFDEALKQLLNDETLCWRRQGPANCCNYEVLDLNSAAKTLEQLIKLFSGTEMLRLLRDYTDLDISGPKSNNPSYAIEIQKWSHGNYTMLGDEAAVGEDDTLDLIYYLNATEGVGIVTYLSPENGAGTAEKDADDASSENSIDEEANDDDESVLLTITAVDNALNLVYRCKGTTKFTKYVSRNNPMEKGPVFLISCSYKE